MELIHGGDAEGFRRTFGTEPLDFSANCSPLGVPEGVRRAVSAAAWHADVYPDPLCRRLCEAIARHEGVPPSWVLCGNGSADIIYRLALAEKPRRALVTAPTFAEYELALRTVDCEVRRLPLRREENFRVTDSLARAIGADVEILFLCNPNNPTGLTVEPGLLRRIAEACRKNGVLLVVDECFNGFLDEPEKHTLRDLLPGMPGLLLLRAFTKLYGMAGLRLGYCLSADEALFERLRDAGQPWAVSLPAQAAGIAALEETDYVNQVRKLVKVERAFLRESLKALGLTVFDGEANYLLFYSDRPDLPAQLRRRGILVRDCANYAGLGEGYCRVAVRSREENNRLLQALREVLVWQNV